jgi:hypothetical protein
MPFGEAKKVYCVEKNEIYPSISFVKDRISSNAWAVVMDPTKTCHGLHYRYATPEDLLKGTPVNPEDYPKKPKVKRAISPYAVVNSDSDEENLPFVKRGWSNEELEKWKKAKEIADNISGYLNELEKIFTAPMNDTEKVESFNVGALLVGKLMVSFCDFCDTQEIYVERGVRGGKIRTKKVEEENKEDDFEYEEVEDGAE